MQNAPVQRSRFTAQDAFPERATNPAHAWSISIRNPHSGLSAGTVGADSFEVGHTCNLVSFPDLPGEDGGSNSGHHFQESFYLIIILFTTSPRIPLIILKKHRADREAFCSSRIIN